HNPTHVTNGTRFPQYLPQPPVVPAKTVRTHQGQGFGPPIAMLSLETGAQGDTAMHNTAYGSPVLAGSERPVPEGEGLAVHPLQ
ncbi:hypothetical protein KIPB_015750, partial [Kipferlia bialata]